MHRHLVTAAGGHGAAAAATISTPEPEATPFLFSPENFRNPSLPSGLAVRDVPLRLATNESLKGFGRIVNSPDEFTTWVSSVQQHTATHYLPFATHTRVATQRQGQL